MNIVVVSMSIGVVIIGAQCCIVVIIYMRCRCVSFVLGYWCSMWCISRQGWVHHRCGRLMLSSFLVWWSALSASVVSVMIVVIVVLCTVGRPYRCRCRCRGGPCLVGIVGVVVRSRLVKLKYVRHFTNEPVSELLSLSWSSFGLG